MIKLSENARSFSNKFVSQLKTYLMIIRIKISAFGYSNECPSIHLHKLQHNQIEPSQQSIGRKLQDNNVK